jgi:hypothetical protein
VFWENLVLNNEWDQMLAEATGEVLETMFFTGVYDPAQPGKAETEPRVGARVRFQGTPCGVLTLSLSEIAARALAANFLAVEPDNPLPDAESGLVVCELANMICGSLLSRVRTPEHFRLSSPELVLADRAHDAAAPPRQSLDLGEGTIDLWLALEPHAG